MRLLKRDGHFQFLVYCPYILPRSRRTMLVYMFDTFDPICCEPPSKLTSCQEAAFLCIHLTVIYWGADFTSYAYNDLKAASVVEGETGAFTVFKTINRWYNPLCYLADIKLTHRIVTWLMVFARCQILISIQYFIHILQNPLILIDMCVEFIFHRYQYFQEL